MVPILAAVGHAGQGLGRHQHHLATRTLDEPLFSRNLGIVTRRRRSLSPTGEALRRTCRDVLGRSAASEAARLSAARG
ncbi:MAG: hypothetical protein ACR2QH_18075 [Geminicoccaceae bacterium]